MVLDGEAEDEAEAAAGEEEVVEEAAAEVLQETTDGMTNLAQR